MVDARGIIGNYVVERELGRGGMGVVYAAKHRVLGRPAAIKLLLANTSDDRGRVERFFNEARAAMAIDHPGVVKIYDVGIAADDRPYIAMELLDGIALASLIHPAGLPVRQGIDYACQIAAALAAAHDAGVIHRDLKPENIIISRDRSRAIVVDFGIAKLAHQATVRTATGALVGTPLYMSPEQCEGLRELDARSDLYAFGCVIFAMLTGRPPFFEGGTGGLIGMHLHVAPPPLRSRCAHASEALERVVSVLLAKSPDARFRTARATLAALQAPEVRGLPAAPGVPATADFAPQHMPIGSSVQPWVAAGGTPVSRDAQTMGSGVSHTGAPPAMGTPNAPVQAFGTPSPSHSTAASYVAAPPQAAGNSRRKLIFAIVASSALTGIIAIAASRGCGGATGPRDAGVAIGSGSDLGSGGTIGSGSSIVAAGSNTIGTATVDAGVARDVAAPPDAAIVATSKRKRTQPSKSSPTATTTTPTTTTPTTTTPMPTADTSKSLDPVASDPPEPVRQPIHDTMMFAKGDFGASLGQRTLDRVAAQHRLDPKRRIFITGHAEQDEPGVLETLAGARANTAYTHLTSRGVPRSVMVVNSTRFIDPPTSNGANRRVDIDFE